jgi:hypothetical protein
MNSYKRKLDKIFTKVDKIAQVGKDNLLEYQKYIDELIDKGDYASFQEMLYIYYNIDTIDTQTVQEVKNNTYNEIIFQTKSSFLTKLSNLYKKKSIYQQSFDIYDDQTSNIIGQIIEIDQYSEDVNYLIKNQMYARLVGEKKTYLKVKKVSDIEYTIITEENTDWSEEQNLLNRYTIALDLIISN